MWFCTKLWYLVSIKFMLFGFYNCSAIFTLLNTMVLIETMYFSQRKALGIAMGFVICHGAVS